MLRKTDPLFGVLPNSSKRLACDFSGMRGIRAKTVNIRHTPVSSRRASQEDSWRIGANLSRGMRRRSLIRLSSMESMRGASHNSDLWKQGRARNPRRKFGLLEQRGSAVIRASETRVAAHFGYVASDFIVLYLTLVAIFDNRHGLLKKFDVGARRKPCQPQSHI
jgi:hypothetical protein